MTRTRIPRLVATALAVIAVMCAAPASAQPGAAQTVLTIHWGAEDFPGTSALDAAIHDALRSRADAQINYFAEYLESETFRPELAAGALRDYIRRKYKDRRIDLVIANTTPAFDFVLTYRHELFPGVPIVFLAGRMPDGLTGNRTGVTGVISDVAFAETLELALRLHPTVRRVFVVAQAPTVPIYQERVREALSRFASRVELNFIKAHSVPELLEAVKALPTPGLLVFNRFAADSIDNVVYSDEVARYMAQVSPLPIYGSTDLYTGSGIVGGMMRESRSTGTLVGQIARRVLDGTLPEEIPIAKVPLTPTFDWRQIKRWGIDPRLLPTGSDIRFRTPTTWEAYRWYIIGTVVVVAAQLILIAALLAQRAQRQRAEEGIRSSEAELRTSYERIRQLAGRLISAQEVARAGIAQDLHDDVCQRLVHLNLAVTGLKNSSGDLHAPHTQEAFTELERDATAMFDGIRRLSHDLHPSSLRILGLAPALKSHCHEIAKRHDVNVQFAIEGDLGHIHPDVALCLFRIAQESLRNGVAHGHARQFTVTIARNGSDISVTVKDNGTGFDLDAVRRNGGGLGLVSMEERAHLVGGKVHVVTAPTQGTSVQAQAPAELQFGHPHTVSSN